MLAPAQLLWPIQTSYLHGLIQSRGMSLLSAFLKVRERVLFVEPPIALVHLLGAWRVHLLDNQAAADGAKEMPRFTSLSGPLATPRQLSSRADILKAW